MSSLIFDEKTLYDGNIFKFEERLKTHVNKYIENGAILTQYFSQDENSTTVDRGTKNIDELFGNKSPLRFNMIDDFPLYGFGQANPENNDEMQIEDFDIEGDCVILPSTIVPKPMDFFIIKHLKMLAIFEVKNVSYDSMKVDGFYKIQYRLHSTSDETIQKLKRQVINNYHTDLNMVGTDFNPIIREDDFILRGKIVQMINKMIQAYRALFYNSRHNCFLFNNPKTGEIWFDMCGNEFMTKFSIMNFHNSNSVIVLSKKVDESQAMLMYNNSVYNWIELGAPARMLQKFYFLLNSSDHYLYSSFNRWGDEVMIMQPISISEDDIKLQKYSFFDDDQFISFLNHTKEPSSEYEKLIWKFINKKDLSIHDVSLYTGDALLSSVNHIDIFLYTPIVIYIIRHILDIK